MRSCFVCVCVCVRVRARVFVCVRVLIIVQTLRSVQSRGKFPCKYLAWAVYSLLFPSHTSYAGLGADQGDHKTHRCTSLFEHNFVIQTKMNRDISEHHTSNNKTKKKKKKKKQQQQQQKQHHEHLNLWQNSPRINKKFRTTIRMSAYCVILKTTPDSCYWNVVSTCPKRDEGMW